MAKQRFKITRVINPSGSEAWRLSGTLNGKQIRKNFKSRNDAVAERHHLSIRYLNEQSEGQTVWTTLTQLQNKEAISAINHLNQAKSNKSLTFAVNYFLGHYKEAAETMTVEEAVHEYCDHKSKEMERGIISLCQEQGITREMKKLKGIFWGRIVNEIQPAELNTYLDTRHHRSKEVLSLKTWNNRRGYLSTFFKYCVSKKYVGENPILEVPQYKIKQRRGSAEILSANEASELMEWLETYRGKQNKDGSWWGESGGMVPYFALALFAGIRPDWEHGEMGKLKSKHIRMDTGVILIEPEVSKVKEKRAIKIQSNLSLWLKKYPLSIYPIIPARRFSDMWAHVRKEHKLSQNVLRHTYISMTVGSFRSVGDAALQAGNSESVIRKYYLDLVTKEEADRFWQIVPLSDQLVREA